MVDGSLKKVPPRKGKDHATSWLAGAVRSFRLERSLRGHWRRDPSRTLTQCRLLNRALEETIAYPFRRACDSSRKVSTGRFHSRGEVSAIILRSLSFRARVLRFDH